MQQTINKSDETFQLDLVSPETVISSEPVSFVVFPASEGQIGVLPGHSPVLTSMVPGVIEIYPANNGEGRKVFVSGGFLDINQTQCTALAVDATPVDDMNWQDCQREYQRLLTEIEQAENAQEKTALEKQLTVQQAKLEAITGKAVV
tara:strand:- start:4 stop:444 length:441 start_codon:yes stop_codon:yes gene_type:complete